MIDVDKFVASIMKCLCMPHREEAYLCRRWIYKALDAQGLKFENGEIVKNQRRVAAEAKEAIFDDEDERIRKRIIHALHGDVLDMEETNKAIAWLEKQGNEPNWCHHKVDLSNCTEEYRKAYYDGWNNCNQQHAQLEAQRKPAWSEEDSKMFNACCDFLTVEECAWLKSLKERLSKR